MYATNAMAPVKRQSNFNQTNVEMATVSALHNSQILAFRKLNSRRGRNVGRLSEHGV